MADIITNIQDPEFVGAQMPDTFPEPLIPGPRPSIGTITNADWSQGQVSDDNALAAFYGTAGSVGTKKLDGPGTPTPVSPSSIDTSGRYPFQRIDFNNEELYAQGQGVLSKAGSAVVKGLGLAGTTFINGTVGLVYGVGKWIDDGKFSSFYDNDLTRSLDGLNKTLENKFANYYTQEELNSDWYSPKNLFSANFLFDKVIKNLGFAVGAALSGSLYTKALTSVRNIAGLGATGRLANALEATEVTLQGTDKAARFAAINKTLSDAARSYVGVYNNLNKAQRVIVAGLSTAGEAGIEALHSTNEFRNKMISDFVDENQRMPFEQELAEIDKFAEGVGNATFGLNVAILTATNYIQFPKILGSSYKAERNILTKSADDIGLFNKSGKLEKTLARTSEEQLYRSTVGASRLSRVSKFGKYFFSPVEAAEEGLQSVVSVGSNNYFDKKYSDKESSILKDLFGHGLEQTLTTKDGIESILIGGLSGAIMTARGTYREAQEESSLRNSAITAFNRSYIKSYLKDTIDAANRGATLQSEREEAIRRGDVLQSKDLEHDFMFNYVLPRIKHGRLDLVKTDIDHYLQLAGTEEGWTELQTDGIVGEADTREAFITRLNTFKQMAQDTSNLFQGLSLKYGSLVREDGTKIYSDEVIEKMVYAGMKVSDYDRRLTQMSNDLLEYGINPDEAVLRSMRFQELDRGPEVEDEGITEGIVGILRDIDNLDVLEDVKENLKQTYSDYFEVALRRRAIMDEYTDIKNNPNKYTEQTPQTLSDTTPTGTVRVKTADGEEDLEIGTEYYLGAAQYFNEKGQLIQRFPKLTILGQNEDGTIKIRTSNGQVRDISAAELEGYKLGKVSDTNANKKAKFVMDNINTPWFYNFGADKGGKVQGFLRYSPKKNILEFVYKDSKGKVRVKEVTSDQFSQQTAKKKGFNEPILTPGKPLSQLQLRSLEEFQAYKDSERRTAKNEFKFKVLSDLANEKRVESERLAKRIESEQNRLSEARVELEEARAQISSFSEETGLTKKNRAFKKELRQIVDLADDLSREITNLERDIATLSATKQDIDIELADLNSIIGEIDALEDGEAMLEQLLGLRYDMEGLADNLEDQMKYLGGILTDMNKLLDELFDFIFAGKNASEYGITDQDLTDLRNNPSTLQFVRNNPELFQRLRDALNRIDIVGDKLDVAQSNIQSIEGELDSLAKKYAEAKRLADLYNNLIDVFDKKAKEWAEEQAQIKLLEQSEKYKKAIFENMKKSQAESGDTFTGDPNEDRKKYADEQDRKKNITHFFISGTDPKYEVKGLENDDYHRRHQRFLDRLLSGTITNSNKIKLVPVTYNNQDSLGLSGFIKADNKEAIRLVYAHEENGFLDENGNVTTDSTKLVYTNLPTTELVDIGNRLRYNNKTKLSQDQIKDLQKQWGETRKKLLEIKDLDSTPTWDFAVSRGIEQTSNKENTVIETGVLSEDQLDQPVISISTTGFIDIRPAGDIPGIEDAVAIPVGRPVLNTNAGLTFLNNHNLSKQQQDDIFGLLKVFSKEVARRALKGQIEGLLGPVEVEGQSYDIIKYLQNVLHWKIPGKDKAVGRNQIWIEDGRLFMGSNKVSIPFTPRSVEANEAVIRGFLSGAYHNVNNQPLNDIEQGKIDEFIELGIDQQGQPFIRNAFKSYNHYLLSSQNPDGSKRQPILTTRLIVPQAGELRFVQRYPIVQMDDLAPKVREIKKEEPKKKEAVKEPKEEGVDLATDTSELNEFINNWINSDYPKDLISVKNGQALTVIGDRAIKYSISTENGVIKDVEVIGILDAKTGTDVISKAPAAALEAITAKMKADRIGKRYGAATQVKDQKPAETASKPKVEVKKEDAPQQAKDDLEAADDTFEESAFRLLRADSLNAEATPEEIKAEEAWFRERFPNISYNTVRNLINTIGGGKAWGMFKDAAVYIYERAEAGTTYHEAFEAVWNAFASIEEKKAMLSEFRSREGSFTNFSGKTVEFKSASYEDAKEQIAEEFRDWKLTGNLPIKGQPKKMGFFKRLWNFIKDFVFGKPADIAETFRRIDKGYYRNFVPRVKNSMPSYREVKQAPEVHIQDMLQGMTIEYFAETFAKDEDLIVALEENNANNLGEVYGKLYNRLQNWFEAKSGGLASYFKGLINNNPKLKEHYTRVYNDIRYGDGQNGNAFGWEFVKDNWSSYVREHTKVLRRYGIDIETSEDTLEDIIAAEEALENKNQVEYERDVLTISAKNAASSTIKMMFSTVADSEFADNTLGYQVNRENSTMKLGKQANYAKLFNYVLHNLSGRNTIYNMHKVLTDMTRNTKIKLNANVRRLATRLKWSDFATKTQNQMRVILKFENVFAKFKPVFTGQRVDFNGNNYTINANTNTKVEQTIRQWLNNFTKGKYIDVRAGKYYIKSIPGVLSGETKARLNFIKEAFGIDISLGEFQNLDAETRRQLGLAIGGAQTAIQNISKTALGSLSGRSLDLNARLNKLAEIYVQNFTGNDLESQHTNLQGKAITNFVIHNYISLTLSDLNDVKNRTEFLNLNPHLKDIYSQDSLLLKPGGLIFNEDGSIKAFKPRVTIPEGRIDDNSGKRTPVDKLSLAERMLYEINENINGRYYILLPADSKTEWSIEVGTYINSSDFFRNRGPQIKKFQTIMKNYLKNEIELARDYNSRKDIVQLSKKDPDSGRVIGKNLRFFKNILSPALVDRIHKEVIDGGKDLFSVVDEGSLDSAIMNFVNNKVASQRKTLEDSRIIEPLEDSIEFFGLSKEWLKENLSKSGNLTDSEVNNILQYRTMNYIINGIEMHKMFFMDPAQFKDATKRVKSFMSGREYSHVDPDGKNFNTWANQNLNKAGDIALKPGTPGYHLFTNSMKTYTLEDVFVVSSNIDEIKEALGDKAAAYENITETDAQSLATISAYREMLWKAGGRWTNRQEEQYQYEMAYERNALLDKKDTKTYPTELQKHDQSLLEKGNPNDNYDVPVVFHTLKPIHSGVQNVKGVAVTSLDKTSMMPMFYRMVEGTQAESLYKQMFKNNVHYVRFETAHKVGIQKSSTTKLYNEDGTVADHSGVNYEYIPYKYYGIQVETSGVKSAQTRGTQLTKLAIMQLSRNGEAIGDTPERKEYIKSLIRQHTEILSELTRRGYNKILSKLGVVENEDGSFTYSDKQKVADFILEEITSRELAENLADGVKIDPMTGDFSIPLEALSNYRGIRNILYSIIEKNINRPKMSGSPKVQVANALFEKNPRIVSKKDSKGNVYYTSNELKFYSIGKDGKTEACEIMLPHWFRYKLRQANSNRTDAEILEYLNKPENQGLLRSVGFRIPTQGLNSVEYFKVKGFLPQEMGDTVVLPSEITAKAGSDFDIDKLNLYLKNFYINKQGYPQLIEFTNIDTNDEQALRDLYEKKYSKYIGKLGAIEREYATKKESSKLTVAILEQMKANELSRAGSEDERAIIEEEYDDIIAEASFTEELRIPTIEEWILENKGKSIYELNTREAVENRYYELLEEIVSLPENFKQLITPNSADRIKEAADYIKKIKNIDQTTSKSIDYSKLIDPDWMARERHKFIIGKGGVGIAAVSQTNIALNQQTGITVLGVIPKFPHNSVVIDGVTQVSVSDINNAKGNSIADNNSGYINGYVDIAKGADIIDMGAELSVASTMMLMEKMGIPNDDEKSFYVSLFIAQPSIQEYLKQDNIIRSVSSMNPYVMGPFLATFGKYSERISNIVRASFPTTDSYLKKNIPQFNYKKMEEMAMKFYRGGKLNEEENAYQMQILNHFLALKELSGDFFKLIQGYNYDTSRFADPNAVYRKQLQYEAAKELTTINSVDRVINNSFESAVKDAVDKSDEALTAVLKLHSGRAKLSVNQIVKEVNNLRGLSRNDKEKIVNQGEMALLNYIIQTKGLIGTRNINEFIGPLMLSSRSAARQLDALKEQLNTTNSANNIIVENLQPSINPDTTRPSIIGLIEKDTDTHMSNMYTSSFRELKNDNSTIVVGGVTKQVSDVYNNIILSHIIQNGAMANPRSFTHLIPVEDYAQIVRTAIDNMNKVNFDFFDDEKVFYRNQWNNKDIVPEAKKKEMEDMQTLETFKFLPGFEQARISPFLKELGIENPNNYRILRLSGFSASHAPVIKETVERINPLTNKLFTPQEKAEMRKKGDYSYRQVKLYKRVEINGEPATTQKVFKGKAFYQFIYKPINAWGDGQNLQEYYDSPRKSAISTNLGVNELSDRTIIDILDRAGYVITNLTSEEIVDDEAVDPTTDTDTNIDEEKSKKDLGFKKGDCN